MEKIEILLNDEESVFEAYNKLLALFDSRDKITFKIDGSALYEILGFCVYLERKKFKEKYNESYGDLIERLRKDNKA